MVSPVRSPRSNRDRHFWMKIKQLQARKLKEKAASGFPAYKRRNLSKKWLLDNMDRMDMQYNENMSKLSANMDRMTNSIADGFTLLRGLLLPQQPAYHPQQHPMYGPPPQPMYHPPQQPMHPPQQPMYSGQQHPVLSGSASSEDTSEPASLQSPGDQFFRAYSDWPQTLVFSLFLLCYFQCWSIYVYMHAIKFKSINDVWNAKCHEV